MYEPRQLRGEGDETVGALAGRAGWTVTGSSAMYAPTEPGWSARVGSVVVDKRAYQQWHVAIVDTRGRARYTRLVATVAEACRLAEQHVTAHNGDTAG